MYIYMNTFFKSFKVKKNTEVKASPHYQQQYTVRKNGQHMYAVTETYPFKGPKMYTFGSNMYI